jgi:hypothetical protein
MSSVKGKKSAFYWAISARWMFRRAEKNILTPMDESANYSNSKKIQVK